MADANDDMIIDIAHVAGNAPDDIKRVLSNTRHFFSNQYPEAIKGKIFSEDIFSQLVVTELSILPKVDEPNVLEGRVVVEVDVTQDMLNIVAGVHGGCSCTLIDMCSALAVNLLIMHNSAKPCPSISQNIHVTFHSPPVLGEKLKIVSTTLTSSSGAPATMTEIWNVTQHRLVASGICVKVSETLQVKM